MTENHATTISDRRTTLAWVMAALGVYWVALIYQLGAQWSVYEQYNYGWAVPFLCAYLAWRHLHQTAGKKQTPEVSPPSSVLYLLLAFCTLLYAPTRFFHEANPIWRLTSLLWALEVIGLTLIFLRLVSGLSRFPISAFNFRFSSLVFPVVFFLVAVPWPSGLENLLVQTFTGLNVSATVELLGIFGVPALQHGNVIEVATGMVGIDEACSGIRSFQATLMIALFFGDFFRLKMMRRVAAVGAGFMLSFVFNLVRTTLLTWVAAKNSPAAVASWHDPAGVTILVACFLALWLMCLWLGKKQAARKEEQSEEPKPATEDLKSEVRSPTASPSTSKSHLITIRGLAIALFVWFLLVEGGTKLWFRLHENSGQTQDWSLNVAAAGAGLTKTNVPAGIRDQFRYDEGVQAAGNDAAGNFWQVYYFRWFPSQSLKSRVANQLAKTHGPEKCLPRIGMTLKSDLGVITVSVGKRQFVLRQFLFLAGGRELHVFYAIYEDPAGTTVLANRRQHTLDRLTAALAGSRNNGQRFLEMAVVGPETPEAARIVLREELEKLIAPR